jgi:chromosome segregation ATPase
MLTNFKLAGTLFGALFSKNPNISEEDKQALATALDTDVDGIKAEHAAAQTAEIDRLKGELGTAQTALTAKEQELVALQTQVADLEPKATKLATIEPEYNTLKAQMDAYKEKVGGKKPNEGPVGAAKTLAEERAEAKEAAEEIDRLRAESPYSMKGF